jgi:biotin carboxyl carrier protein
VQAIGDGTGVVHVGERECTIQRSYQKLIEVAPSPSLTAHVRETMLGAALRMARHVRLRGLATFEFLLDARDGETFVFIEANPRLQVEHTVTEAVYGVDLVQSQLLIASAVPLVKVGISSPRGCAIQLRINLETIEPDGSVRPTVGTLAAYEPPAGIGMRVDGYGYAGYRTNPAFDSLLAKVIVHAPSGGWGDALASARRALAEFRIEGVATNLPFLAALLAHPDVAANRLTTRFVDAEAPALAASARAVPGPFFAAAMMDTAKAALLTEGPPGTQPVTAPMQALVVELPVAEGDAVRAGQNVAVLEAMKMQSVIVAPCSGIVRMVAATRGKVIAVDQPLLFIEPGDVETVHPADEADRDPDFIRPDLAELLERKARALDTARPEAVAKRHRQGGRTGRENVEDLLDPGGFVEYGALVVAGQRARRSMDELIRVSPADRVIAGFGTVNAALFGEDRAGVAVAAYDYTALAGTQGTFGHKKQDRIFKLTAQLERPLVLFGEGGGGRPGETDKAYVTSASLDIPTFHAFAHLSGLVPLIGVVHGRCLAGNAALLGCCDVIIADETSCIGMGGPAMIEGGGLGAYRAEEVGPVSVQAPNGVIDILVRDEAEAVTAAKRYLSYFQGALADWSCRSARIAPADPGRSLARL